MIPTIQMEVTASADIVLALWPFIFDPIFKGQVSRSDEKAHVQSVHRKMFALDPPHLTNRCVGYIIQS